MIYTLNLDDEHLAALMALCTLTDKKWPDVLRICLAVGYVHSTLLQTEPQLEMRRRLRAQHGTPRI